MCEPVSMGIMAAASAIGAGASILQGSKAAKAQKTASMQAQKDAADTKAANERAINQANQKKPNVAGLFANNFALNSGGVGSTLLTSARGAAPSLLGASTLLGR